MAAGDTLILNPNITSSKVLIGIARNVGEKSISSWLSSGSAILKTNMQNVRITKKVSVLIPFLVGAVKADTLLTQLQAGAISASKAKVGERILTLANELVTDPVIYRPRDTEVITADQLLKRYKSSYVVSATIIKDELYFKTIMKQGKDGLTTGEKIGILDTTAARAKTTMAARGEAYTELIDTALSKITEHRDGVIQGGVENISIAVSTRPSIEKDIRKNSALTIKTDAAYATYAKTSPWRLGGMWDGVHEFKSSIHLIAADIDFIVMVKGVAVSAFLFLDMFNFDKTGGFNSYKMSLEFNEGTGLFLPQLIWVGAPTTIHAAQDAVGSGSVDFAKNTELATTTSTNPA